MKEVSVDLALGQRAGSQVSHNCTVGPPGPVELCGGYSPLHRRSPVGGLSGTGGDRASWWPFLLHVTVLSEPLWISKV